MRIVNVNTPSKGYPVYVAGNLLENAGTLAAEITGICKAAIITDDNVNALYAQKLEDSLIKAGFETVKYVFKSGEQSKNADNLFSILNFLADNQLSSSDAVFALGGGVVGDIAGFAAAVYLRGIKLVQIPTTLLAMVDSSIGGKTAIDLRAGKNMAGAFYQPSLVICDTSTLTTLDSQQIANGFSEIIKYAVICDRDLFNHLKHKEKCRTEELIVRCIEIKCDIVASDERDTGARHILNFGHTFAHAIEKCSNFTESHGRAVSIGMSIITKASAKMNICTQSYYHELIELLEMYELPSKTIYNEEELYNAAVSDKKRKADNITLVLPEAIGKCVLKTVSLTEMRKILRLGIS